ncbi:hypothetical protein V8C37DRAFT_394153 [Trichoderma ceciliae]
MASEVRDDAMAKLRTTSKRSRNGCINCRTRRIKCDEKQPTCGRCSHLNLSCCRPEPPIPLRVRRRGCGPVKSRSISRWEPPKILPNIQQTTPDYQPISPITKSDCTPPQQINCSGDLDITSSTAVIRHGVSPVSFTDPTSWNNGMDTTITSPEEEMTHQLADGSVQETNLLPGPLQESFDDSFGPLLDGLVENPDSHEGGSSFLAKLASPLLSLSTECIDVCLQPPWLNSAAVSNGNLLDAPTDPICAYTDLLLMHKSFQHYWKLQQTVVLSSSKLSYELADALNLNHDERKALDYYRCHIACFRSVKGFSWSAYSIFLSTAANSSMVLHFLLAISLRGLSQDTRDAGVWRLSRIHLNNGLRLLQEKGEGRSNEIIEVMVSFWFLALFTMENDSLVSGVQRRELSTEVYRYSRAHLLNEVCGPPDTSMAAYSTTEGSAAKISLVMKILSMIANVDVQLNFCGHGGRLSQFCYEKDRMRNILQMSSNYLELNHGDKYPSWELVYDIESSECSKAYHDQNQLYHRLNQLFWFGIGDYESIEKDIEARELNHRSFFRIAHRDTGDDCNYSRLYFQIDVAVCEFYAIRLYHFRCQSEKMPDEKVQNWVASYLQIAHRLQQMKVRYHWFDKSLFLVGAEIHDAIHRDWIQRRMLRADLKKALMCVWEKEKMHRRRLSREEFQAILRSEADMYDAAPTTAECM